jgi:hypothetical protein
VDADGSAEKRGKVTVRFGIGCTDRDCQYVAEGIAVDLERRVDICEKRSPDESRAVVLEAPVMNVLPLEL